MTTLTIAAPKFHVGQRINTFRDGSGVIVGASYVFQPSPYDIAAGWNYLIEFQRRSLFRQELQTFCDSLHESDLERWQQKTASRC